MALRHHVPEKSGIGLVGAPIAGKTRIAVEMKPAAARPKQFREMTPIPLLRIPNVLTLPHCHRRRDGLQCGQTPFRLASAAVTDVLVSSLRATEGNHFHEIENVSLKHDYDLEYIDLEQRTL